jgi:hypothetical protein
MHLNRVVGVVVFFVLLFASACKGPCGNPVIQCWTSIPGCNHCDPNVDCYQQYTGSGTCPDDYYCVDPRHPAADASPYCPMDFALPGDGSPNDVDAM